MIGDAKEHVCSGCYEVIATHDPEAYQQGSFYYHSKAHEDRHVSRNWNAFRKAEGENSRAATAPPMWEFFSTP
jgi:hypothetical protein